MNVRRTLVILGSIALLLLCAIVFIAVWFHRQEELEKNRAKMAPARARRAEKASEPEPVKEPEPEVIPEPVIQVDQDAGAV